MISQADEMVATQSDREFAGCSGPSFPVSSIVELVASDIMEPKVCTVHQEAPMKHAAKVMGEKGIRHLIVTDTFGKPIGIFSERDMLRHIASHAASGQLVPGRVAVKEVMSKSLATISADESLPGIAAGLAAQKIGCLPVTDKRGVLVGIVSVVDVLRVIANIQS